MVISMENTSHRGTNRKDDILNVKKASFFTFREWESVNIDEISDRITYAYQYEFLSLKRLVALSSTAIDKPICLIHFPPIFTIDLN